MTRIIIAGDSWGAHSYESRLMGLKKYPSYKAYKSDTKKSYAWYPGPGHWLSELTDTEIITTADHGVSNTEGLDALEKVVTKNDIVIFYKTGLLREVYKGHLDKTEHYVTDCFKHDHKYYSNKFYERCSKIQAKKFYLIGGCVRVRSDLAKEYNIDVILPSITSWLHLGFKDNEYDTTTYWLEYQYDNKRISCDHFKRGVTKSYDKMAFWRDHRDDFWKYHPTIATNKKLVKFIHEHIEDLLKLQ